MANRNKISPKGSMMYQLPPDTAGIQQLSLNDDGGGGEDDITALYPLRGKSHLTEEEKRDIARQEWKHYMDDIEENKEQLTQKIRSGKEKLIQQVVACTDKLLNNVENICQASVDTARQNLAKLDSKQNGRRPKSAFGQRKSHYEIKDEEQSSRIIVPKWQLIDLEATNATDYVISKLCGTLRTINRPGQETSRGLCLDEVVVKNSLEFLSSFTLKTKFDSLPCGIGDMAHLPNGNVLVVDRPNKSVKSFAVKTGYFNGFIGRTELVAPSRILAAKHTSKVLVSDSETRNVKVFKQDGTYLGNFVSNLKNPSSLAETSHGHIVVLEYSTKTVIIYTPDGLQLHQFTVEQMATPSHITVGSTLKANTARNSSDAECEDVIFLSDWRSRVVQAYDTSGKRIWSYNNNPESGTSRTKRSDSLTVDAKMTPRLASESAASSPVAKGNDMKPKFNARLKGHCRTGSDSSFFDCPSSTPRSTSIASLKSTTSSGSKPSPTGTPTGSTSNLDASVPVSIKQPQGLEADRFGHLLVADAQGSRIVAIEASTGKFVAELTCHNIKKKLALPMCLHSDGAGELSVAEYTGTLKRFCYAERNHSSIDEELVPKSETVNHETVDIQPFDSDCFL